MSESLMPQYIRLREEYRVYRRTIADAIDVVRERFGLVDPPEGYVTIGHLTLPSGQKVGLVDVRFPDVACIVSLPTAARFTGLPLGCSSHTKFEIADLDGGLVLRDGSVRLRNGTRLRATEVIPSPLPYKPSELDQRILWHAILLAGKTECLRSLREGLPERLRSLVPDLVAIDYSRLEGLDLLTFKKIRIFIEDHDPELKISAQKIADALAIYGVRRPRRRPRVQRARPATI